MGGPKACQGWILKEKGDGWASFGRGSRVPRQSSFTGDANASFSEIGWRISLDSKLCKCRLPTEEADISFHKACMASSPELEELQKELGQQLEQLQATLLLQALPVSQQIVRACILILCQYPDPHKHLGLRDASAFSSAYKILLWPTLTWTTQGREFRKT